MVVSTTVKLSSQSGHLSKAKYHENHDQLKRSKSIFLKIHNWEQGQVATQNLQ